MNKNEGSTDRVIRIILGIILIVGGFFFLQGTWGIILGIVGFIPLITGIIGWCPIYAVSKISTRKS